MEIEWQITFFSIDFAELMNRNSTILNCRLYLPNLKDEAGLEDAQLILNLLFSANRAKS